MTPGSQRILIGLIVFLAVWYVVASFFNRRRGITVFHWLRNGLDRLGGETAARWIGSSGSGARIQVRKAEPPFRDLEIIYLLASRELLPLFLADLLRGKRDRVIVRARLRSAPQAELEVAPPRSKAARQMQAEKDRPWSIEGGPRDLLVGARGRDADTLRAALTPLLEKYETHVQSISWSREAPHLILILSLAGLYERGGNAAELYDDLAAVATTAGQGSRS
jgi:hypothetical protein